MRTGQPIVKRSLPLEQRARARRRRVDRQPGSPAVANRASSASWRCAPLAFAFRESCSRRAGRVWAPNIPGWDDYPLKAEIKAAVSDQAVKIAIDSDRSASILGEAWQGAARDCRNAIFLAVGTGIGAGIFVDGRVLHGAHGIAGAIGWMALDRPFRPEYVALRMF